MPKKEAYLRKGYKRKKGIKVKAARVRFPKLTPAERKRRAGVAKAKLVPAATKWVGKVGFRKAVKELKGKPGIRSPKKLAGWHKGEAEEKGELSPKHPYVGRRGFKKYPAAAKRMAKKEYQAFLRRKRGGSSPKKKNPNNEVGILPIPELPRTRRKKPPYWAPAWGRRRRRRLRRQKEWEIGIPPGEIGFPLT